MFYRRGSWWPRAGRGCCGRVQHGAPDPGLAGGHLPLSSGQQSPSAALPGTRAHKTRAWDSADWGCVLASFKPCFFHFLPQLVTVSVIGGLFSWGGRLHLVPESDSCSNLPRWPIPCAVSAAYGGGLWPRIGTELSFDGDSPFPFLIISEAPGPSRGGVRGQGSPNTEPPNPQEDEALQIGELEEGLDCP